MLFPQCRNSSNAPPLTNPPIEVSRDWPHSGPGGRPPARVRRWPESAIIVRACNGIGRPLAALHRLAAARPGRANVLGRKIVTSQTEICGPRGASWRCRLRCAAMAAPRRFGEVACIERFRCRPARSQATRRRTGKRPTGRPRVEGRRLGAGVRTAKDFWSIPPRRRVDHHISGGAPREAEEWLVADAVGKSPGNW